jgi:GNAT superfamily N-acetyltransferase
MLNPGHMLVRDATLKDAAVIAKNNVLLAKESEGETLDRRTALSGAKALLSDEGKGFYIVAEEDGLIIGQTMITFEWSDWRDRPIWWLQSVYVDPSWRKKGVFKKLFDEVKRRAKKARVGLLRLYVHTSNKKAIDVYTKIGLSEEHYRIYGTKMD